jgi:hypothetical protein
MRAGLVSNGITHQVLASRIGTDKIGTAPVIQYAPSKRIYNLPPCDKMSFRMMA